MMMMALGSHQIAEEEGGAGGEGEAPPLTEAQAQALAFLQRQVERVYAAKYLRQQVTRGGYRGVCMRSTWVFGGGRVDGAVWVRTDVRIGGLITREVGV
jgi:hypothetical protein